MFSFTFRSLLLNHMNSNQLRFLSDSTFLTKHNFNNLLIKKLNIKNALMCEPSDQIFSICGWVKSTRKQRPLAFIDISDGSVNQRLQVVVNEQLMQKLGKELYNDCSIRCVGKIVKSQGNRQSIELLCDSLEILGKCDPLLYPFAQRNKSYESSYMRQYLHLRVRLQLFSSILRIRSEAINGIHIYMKQNHFINITTPIITSNDCEGGGQVFTVKSPFCGENASYFDKETYLTVSSQLHLEAMACAMSRVYTLTQSFRAEMSRMRRKHLSEFLMFEVEEAFIESLDDIMDRVETICKFIAYYIRQQCTNDLNAVLKETKYQYFDKIANSKYIRMTYSQAIQILTKSGKFPNLKFGEDLNAEQERTLVEYTDNTPVFVTHFPTNIKPFYMKQINGQALCFDLLSPICGEVCGGSLREDNYEELEQRINSLKGAKNLKWYLDLRQFGPTPHGGFGIGFDRFIQTMTGILNIKDVATFPRWPKNCLL